MKVRHNRCWFKPWIGKIPGRRAWQSTPVFLPRESHGQRSLERHNSWGHKETEAHHLSYSLLLFLLTVESFSIFGYKEHSQFDFSIDHLVISMCRIVSCVVGKGCLLDQCVLLTKLCQPLPCFILYSKAKLACIAGIKLLHSAPPQKKSNRSLLNSFQQLCDIVFVDL